MVCLCKRGRDLRLNLNQENEKLVADIQKSFLSLLKEHLPKNLLNKVKDKQTIKILSIGCGRFREAKCLFEYFSGYENQIKLYGIEIQKDLLDLANQDPIIKEKSDSIFLKLDDATLPENYQEWLSNGKFDLLIVRHPEITFNTDIFIKIFSTCTNLLKKEGYILTTTHFENEKEAFIMLLKLVKFKLLTCVENKNSPVVKKANETLYSDRFLLISSID